MSRSKALRGTLAASLLASGAVAALSSSPAAAQATVATKAFIQVPANRAFAAGDYSIPSAGVSLTGNETGPLVLTMNVGGADNFVLTLTPRTSAPFVDTTAPPANYAPNHSTSTVLAATATNPGMTLARPGATCTNPTGTLDLDSGDFPTPAAALAVAVRFSIQCSEDTAVSASGFAFFNQPLDPLDPLANLAAGEFNSMAPVRLLDTRFGAKLGPLGTTDVDLLLDLNGQASGVPAGAIAVVVNLTAVKPSVNTVMSLYPAGVARPVVSNLNPVAQDTVANLATVKVGAGNKITLYNELGSTDAIVDVVGFYLADNGAVGGGDRFVSQTPVRKLDTRVPTAGPTPLTAGEVRIVDLGTTADAVMINLTVTNPTAGGYVAVYPEGVTTVPNISNANFVPGQTVGNLVVVKADAGKIKVINPTLGTLHVVIDLIGTFELDAANATGAGRYVAIDPQRVYNSRDDVGETPLASGVTRDVNLLALLDKYPFEYQALMANLTVTSTNNLGYLTAFPAAGTVPFVSNVNWTAQETRANQFVSGTDADGFTSFFHGAPANVTGSANFIVDVSGYFTQ